ncbi:MAG TPA: glycosyltransferase [Flavisolibacter sp.]|jgi:glycosyltransferase involved in cell wall biosynthesis|nr:glycosyltransferase [Flavisolibacter sp.]
MPKGYSATVVLPLYKPSGNWTTPFIRNVSALNACLTGEQLQYIVVHDGPVDADLQKAFVFLSSLLTNVDFLWYDGNKGKGHALRRGVEAASSPYILLVDFDFPYCTENICTILNELRKGEDVVVGRRKKAYFAQVPLKRMLISKLFSLLNRLFISLPLFDTQSGIKGFNLAGRAIFLETVIDRFLVDTEFLMRVHKTNLTVGIVDIDLKPDVVFSDFGMKVVQTELYNFARIFYLSKRLQRRIIAPRNIKMEQLFSLRA